MKLIEISAINPLATSYELVHYFAIAEPKIIAVDSNLLSVVEAALKDSHLLNHPTILIINDKKSESPDRTLPMVYSVPALLNCSTKKQ
jgi:hypothetical protein